MLYKSLLKRDSPHVRHRCDSNYLQPRVVPSGSGVLIATVCRRTLMYRQKRLPLVMPAIRNPRCEDDSLRVFKGIINGACFSIVIYGVIAALLWTVVHFHFIHIHL